MATLVKVEVLEGDDALESGSQRRHFSFFRVDCSLVVGCGSIATIIRISIRYHSVHEALP